MKYVSALILLGLLSADIASPQGAQEACEVKVVGQNRDRLIDCAVNVECGYDIHSARFDNWGVSSNYGNVTNRDQFRGWKHLDGPSTKRQWNSCTTWVPQYRPPSTTYYTPPTYTDQRRSDRVDHGSYRVRLNVRRCPRLNLSYGPRVGCSGLDGHTIIENNYMVLYEFDRDGNDFVTTRYYPSPSLTLSGCTLNHCSKIETDWEDPTSSTNPGTGVTAEMRVVVTSRFQARCSD